MTDLLPVRSDLCHGPSCTEKITATSPSQDFHSEACHARWNQRWTAKRPASAYAVAPHVSVAARDLLDAYGAALEATAAELKRQMAQPRQPLPLVTQHAETFASLIPDEPRPWIEYGWRRAPAPKRTAAGRLWAWLRGKR